MLQKGNGSASSRMLTVREVATLLHVHPNTIRLWSKIGVLKAYRIGKRGDYRFSLNDLDTFLSRNGKAPDTSSGPG